MNTKIIDTLFLTSAIALIVSCQQEELSPSQERETVELQFTCAEVLMQDSSTPDTRTAWTGKDVIWSEGDQIAVTYKTSSKWSTTIAQSDPLPRGLPEGKFQCPSWDRERIKRYDLLCRLSCLLHRLVCICPSFSESHHSKSAETIGNLI